MEKGCFLPIIEPINIHIPFVTKYIIIEDSNSVPAIAAPGKLVGGA